jgi:hypothetical protein
VHWCVRRKNDEGESSAVRDRVTLVGKQNSLHGALTRKRFLDLGAYALRDVGFGNIRPPVG